MRRLLFPFLLLVAGCQQQKGAQAPSSTPSPDVVAVRGAQGFSEPNLPNVPTEVIAEGQRVQDQASKVSDQANSLNQKVQDQTNP